MALTINKTVKAAKPSLYDVHLSGAAPVKATNLKFTQAVATVQAEKHFQKKTGKAPQVLQDDSLVVHQGILTNTEPCLIKVGGGQTINIGNFESVRLDVSLSMPCEKSEIEATYDYASDWVSTKLMEAINSAKA